MEYDVVIVGGGPAGLSAGIRLKQLAEKEGREIEVCILEKGSEIGAHILSGNVFDPRALDELLPEWRTMDGHPMTVPVESDNHWILTKGGHISFPHILLPPFMDNDGCYTMSLAAFCRWLGGVAEGMGVEIFPGFAAAEVLFNEDGSVKGVATGSTGIQKDGTRGPNFELGMELHAKYTFFAEGVRGHLTKELKRLFELDKDSEPQIYGLGVKELWDVEPDKHEEGCVIHTQGWPLEDANGGGFIYHQADGQVALGFVTWLNYKNPHISPFQEMQKWKTHPEIAELLKGGKRISYGARAINDGGLQSVPKLAFPGGALIGCSAGFLNVPRIKGTHTAMKSAMMAADAAFAAVGEQRRNDELTAYRAAYDTSWVKDELSKVRNTVPLVKRFGNLVGTILSGMTMWAEALRIKMPFTLGHKPDHESIGRKEHFHPPVYPKPDGVITFDRLSSVFLSGTNHEEDQPPHLQLKDASIPIEHNLPLYDEPAQRYCPAGVYEVVGEEEGNPTFVINAQNCVHCKTCDIKDPLQNINWVVPEGGGGPNYPNM
ncbi:MAG: electron transfer flavoprotein-ubiquinone oxidoreductase [Pacificimonas sp.]|nr:electron transfer flavoprotein-ubiquinone oxidoreductase [Pacificimonas sp.]